MFDRKLHSLQLPTKEIPLSRRTAPVAEHGRNPFSHPFDPFNSYFTNC